MKPTDVLSNEHRVIEQVLDCLERMVEECRTSNSLEAQPARDAVRFFHTFADRCHHGKEEVHLFPAMEAKGFSRAEGPVGVMLREHEAGRGEPRRAPRVWLRTLRNVRTCFTSTFIDCQSNSVAIAGS